CSNNCSFFESFSCSIDRYHSKFKSVTFSASCHYSNFSPSKLDPNNQYSYLWFICNDLVIVDLNTKRRYLSFKKDNGQQKKEKKVTIVPNEHQSKPSESVTKVDAETVSLQTEPNLVSEKPQEIPTQTESKAPKEPEKVIIICIGTAKATVRDIATSTNTRTSTIGIKETKSDKDKVFGRTKKQGASSGRIKRSDIGREKGENSKGGLNEYFIAIPKRVPTAKDERRDGKAEKGHNNGIKAQNSRTKTNQAFGETKKSNEKRLNAKLALDLQKVNEIKEQIKLAIDIELKKLYETEKPNKSRQLNKFKKLNPPKKLKNLSKRQHN
ncbi:hypothetical protein RFI_19869, partial [Reticulomyxa filosa]